jgi:hypothetical protein
MSDDTRKANTALGILVIALMFMLEVVVMERASPQPITPWVLSLLSLVAVGAAAACWWFRKKARGSAQ